MRDGLDGLLTLVLFAAIAVAGGWVLWQLFASWMTIVYLR